MKKANGDGSVYEDKARNKWVAAITDPFGKRVRKRFDTQKEAKDWLKLKQGEILQQKYVTPNNITLEEWLNKFIDVYKAPHLKRTTVYKYRCVANYIIKGIGKYKLQELNPLIVKEFYGTLQNLSPTMRKQLHLLLVSASRTAVVNDYIVKDFTLTLKAPKVTLYKDIEIFTKEEMDKIYEVCSAHSLNWKAMFMLTANTGIRRGELLGLKIENVFDDHIYVAATLQDISGNKYLELPKTKTSIREVPISQEVSNVLKEVIADRKEGFLFVTANNTTYYATNFMKAWYRLLAKAGVPKKKFHCIRHTFASNMIAAGVPIATVSQLLGHSSPVITMSVYVHPVHEMDTEVLKIKDKLFSFEGVATKDATK